MSEETSRWEKYKESQKRAQKNYMKGYTELRSNRVPVELKEEVVDHISTTGESMNTFIIRAVKETMERDKNVKAPAVNLEEFFLNE